MIPLLLAMSVAVAPEPVLPTPSPRQLTWQSMERYAFVHFGPNTFTGLEWGKGSENPEVFDPKHLDCRQWVRTFKKAGFKGVIITAKHHDGFCLWPSDFSTHTVKQSKWKNGKGDVLRELSNACKAEGMKMGVYLSPWDRNHPAYGTPQYNEVFKSMLREVLTHYGPIFEVWFDGANGEGPNGKKMVYDWPGFISVVRECQPNAVIFSDAGPDIRWVGNEDGFAGETNWGMIDAAKFSPGHADQGVLNSGLEQGSDWVPSECDVSIRPGWFWRSSEDTQVKSLDKLMDIYYGSVGRGSNLLLNVPPNADGKISDPDVKRLLEFNKAIEADYSKWLQPFVVNSPAEYHYTGATKMGGIFEFKTWGPESAITVDLGDRHKFDRAKMKELLTGGQRVKAWELQAESDQGWKTFAQGTTIGAQRLLRFPTQETRHVRIIILDAKAPPTLTDFGFFRSPAIDREE